MGVIVFVFVFLKNVCDGTGWDRESLLRVEDFLEAAEVEDCEVDQKHSKISASVGACGGALWRSRFSHSRFRWYFWFFRVLPGRRWNLEMEKIMVHVIGNRITIVRYGKWGMALLPAMADERTGGSSQHWHPKEAELATTGSNVRTHSPPPPRTQTHASLPTPNKQSLSTVWKWIIQLKRRMFVVFSKWWLR